MKRPIGPTVSQRILGAELRRHRESLGMSCKEVGHQLAWSETKVSRLEKARNSIHRNDLRLLAELYQLTGEKRDQLQELVKPRSRQRGWWNAYRDIVPERRWVYVRLEDEAEQIRSFDLALIPGLLQTEGYARSIVSIGSPQVSAETQDRRVQVRMVRQRVLTREYPVHLWAIIDEAAIQRTAAMPAKVARPQLEHLVEVATLPTVTLQVLPTSQGPHIGMDGSFSLIGFPDPAGEVVFIETGASSLFLEEPHELDTYDLTFKHLQAEALGCKDSIELIQIHAQSTS